MIEPTQSFFGPRIADTRRRADLITNQSQRHPGPGARYVDSAIEELNVTLEELRVADEELRQQNAELEASLQTAAREHQRYRALFEFSPVGLLVSDSNGVIREANKTAAQLLGRERQFLMGKPMPAMFDDDSRTALRERMYHIFDSTTPAYCWVTTATGRNAPKRLVLTLQGDATEGEEPVIRWAVQPRGNGANGNGDAETMENPISDPVSEP